MSTAATPNNTLPRAVLDIDANLASTWPAPLSDGSWVTCLGQVVVAPGGAANDYTLNVRASVYVKANLPAAGNLFTFGRDPRMHVTGVGKTSVVAAEFYKEVKRRAAGDDSSGPTAFDRVGSGFQHSIRQNPKRITFCEQAAGAWQRLPAAQER